MQALALAMNRRREDLAASLGETARLMAEARESGQTRAYLRLDTQFHQAIFDHADNGFLNEAYQTIASKLAALRNRLESHPDHLKKGFIEHLRLAELVTLGDENQARAVLDSHIARRDGSFWVLNDGLAGVERKRPRTSLQSRTSNISLRRDRRPSTP
jgi:DNA-binding GntR family transcriptional regulator